MQTNNTIKYVFWGSSNFSVTVLEEMKNLGFMPSLIITTPDKPQGRKLVLTPNVVKVWADENTIEIMNPAKLDDVFVETLKEKCSQKNIVVFIVASYGKIIPNPIINIPAMKTLNIHPSLLPQYRGASPLPTAILEDTQNTGVTIMRIDEQMDHGPIVAQKGVTVTEWPTYEIFEENMAKEGAELLVKILPEWVSGNIKEADQDHTKATYTKKISKEDAQIDLNSDAYDNFRKIKAYHEWPVAFFIFDHNGKNIRVKITSAEYSDGKLVLKRVIPEGSKEMNYSDFLRGYQNKP